MRLFKQFKYTYAFETFKYDKNDDFEIFNMIFWTAIQFSMF